MYNWIVNMRLQAILECYVDDVIRSQNKSKLWTTIAMSKFELEKRSTAQNVANWTGYQKFKFQFHIQISKFWQVSNLRLPFHCSCYTMYLMRCWIEINHMKLHSASLHFAWTVSQDKTQREVLSDADPQEQCHTRHGDVDENSSPITPTWLMTML